MQRKYFRLLLKSFLIVIFFLTCSYASSKWKNTYDNAYKHYEKGVYDKAIKLFQESMQEMNFDKDSDYYINALIFIKSMCQSLGYHIKALPLLENAKPIVEKSKDKSLNALFYSALGDLHFSLGNGDMAIRYFEKGAQEAHLSKNPYVQATLLNNIGNIFLVFGNQEKAVPAYEKSLKLMQEFRDDPLLTSKIYLNLITYNLNNGKFTEGLDYIYQADKAIDKQKDTVEKVNNLFSLSEHANQYRYNLPESDQDLKNLSYKLLKNADSIAEKLSNNRLTSYAKGLLAVMYEDEERFEEAIRLTRSAIFYATQGNSPDILYRWQWQLGRLLINEDINKAVIEYRKAITTLNPIRQDLFKGIRTEHNLFENQIKPVYLELAELLLIQAESSKKKDKLTEARDVIELLKTAELQNFFEDECAIQNQNQINEIDHSDKNTAIIFPIILPDRVVMLLTLPDGMKQVSVSIDSYLLEETVKTFRKSLQNRMNNRFLYNAEKLYNWLIKPLVPFLEKQNVKTLIFAPDGVLRLIPFTTLYDGEKYLIEKYAISIIPAMSLTDFDKSNTLGTSKKVKNTLLCGLSESRFGFNALPSVQDELKDIKIIMGSDKIFANKDFSVQNITQEFKNKEISIAHIATHGVFGGTPEDSYLLFYDKALTMDGLEDLISLGRYKKEKVSLLTLSACQTALGNERAAMGLAGVAVKAGVKSVLATLWYVDDEATSFAIREFYRQLKTGITKAKAIQNTQKKMISIPRYWKPLYWAPFILIGNWN